MRTPSIEARFVYVEPIGNEPNLCPQYESTLDDPEFPCVLDAIELGEAGCVECWRGWDGPRLGFICPFID